MNNYRSLDYDGMKQQIFLELLRNYHNKEGQDFAAQPPEEVAFYLHKEAGDMTTVYFSAETGK